MFLKNEINERKTIVTGTPGVFHHYFRFTYLPGTKSSYVFLCMHGLFGVMMRRYICLSCAQCIKLNCLNCNNEYCCEWKFYPLFYFLVI